MDISRRAFIKLGGALVATLGMGIHPDGVVEEVEPEMSEATPVSDRCEAWGNAMIEGLRDGLTGVEYSGKRDAVLRYPIFFDEEAS